MNTPNPLDEYAHLAWQDHPDNPANYPDMANQRQTPTNDDKISWEEAYSLGVTMMTQSELEALGFDEDDTDNHD